MKYILYFLLMLAGFFILAKVTHFEEREKAQNKYMCAVYGYKSDCVTPLRPEDRLK